MAAGGGRIVAARRAAVRLAGVHDAVYEALGPEVAAGMPRARLMLRHPGCGRVEITVEAEDTTSLRAAVNSLLRSAEVADRSARAAVPSRPSIEPET